MWVRLDQGSVRQRQGSCLGKVLLVHGNTIARGCFCGTKEEQNKGESGSGNLTAMRPKISSSLLSPGQAHLYAKNTVTLSAFHCHRRVHTSALTLAPSEQGTYLCFHLCISPLYAQVVNLTCQVVNKYLLTEGTITSPPRA